MESDIENKKKNVQVSDNAVDDNTNVDPDDEMAQIEKEILELENQANDSNVHLEDDLELELAVDEKEIEEDLISILYNSFK